MAAQGDAERIHTVVIGAGQAGLTTGYHLARRGIPFVILEANPRVGDSWRRRWRSLRLFTPAAFDGLPGMPFPAPPGAFPTKDEMADYLEAYAARLALPVRTGVRVERLAREGGRLVVTTGVGRIEAENVVVAMATFQAPRVPACAAALAPAIVQLRSRDYRDPSQLRPGGVLVVGAGNSGAELAIEAARAGHRTWLSGRDVGHIPIQIEPAGAATRLLLRFIFRVVFHRILTTGTPIGRRARPRIVSHGGPLIRLKPADLAAAGVERVPRLADVRDGRPVLADGRSLEVESVVWCTGFHPGFSWIDLPVLGQDGEPVQDRGVVAREPGLHFVGLHYLYALSSTMIHGVDRDAEHVVRAIAARARAAAGPADARTARRDATAPLPPAPAAVERRA